MQKMLPRSALAAAVLTACALVSSAAPAGAIASPTWQPVYQATSHPDGQYTSVVATSTRNAWAVGTGNTSRGLIAARWNGTRWQSLVVPGASAFAAIPFPVVVASSAINVWIFGWLTNGTEKILRWNGSWHTAPLPADGAADSPVIFSSTDVWAIGSQRVGRTGSCVTTLWNWTGAKWTAHAVGFCATGLGGTSAKDVWVVGIRKLPATKSRISAAYWNGTRWNAIAMPHPYTYAWSPQVEVGSVSNVWLTGDNRNSGNPVQPGTGWVLHWNGKSWSQARSSGLDASPGVALTGNELWMGPDQEWTGSAWANQTPDPALFGPPSAGGVNPDLLAIASIPGSATLWGAGVLNAGGGYNGPLMAAFGTVP
jgi:hypothetical protein